MLDKIKAKSFVLVLVLFAGAFFVGRFTAQVVATGGIGIQRAADGNWGLSFQEEGQPPVANATFEELAKYDAYYAENTKDKVLYLNFDCVFENLNKQAILYSLKKNNAKANFFVVGNYLSTSPDLVKQMLEEGHNVGNHSYHHPDMTQMGKEEFAKELGELEQLYEQTTGKPMVKYYRPPQGKYSENNLKIAKELGYKTFFWSLAYVDWKQDSQPTHEEAFDKLLKRVHPGAIVLLHNTSKTNGEILDELLTKWEGMGYTFKSLDELPGMSTENTQKNEEKTPEDNTQE